MSGGVVITALGIFSVSKKTSRLPATVVALGVVSFFTDFSSEMIYPLLPVFLSEVLGAGALALGIIEGVAESTASFLKIASGVWADRAKRRKPFIVAGYGLAGAARPLIGLAGAWPVVLTLRFFDRMGKGIRTSPRDALIADVTPPERRGAAFGLHRAMDHAGSAVGPLVAAFLVGSFQLPLRQVFLLAAIPAVIVMIVLVVVVREVPRQEVPAGEPLNLRANWKELGPDFRKLLLAVLIFTLGNASDAFLLLRFSDVGVPAAWIAVLWSAHSVVKMASTWFGGRLSDRLGRRPMVFSGWIFYAAMYFIFGWIEQPVPLVAAFMAYGFYFGLTEPCERAWIADLAPVRLRGAAYGYFSGAVGIAALPASVLFGFLWNRLGAPVAFATGGGLALMAALLLYSVRQESQQAVV